MILLQLLILALLIYLLVVQHRGFKVSVHLPEKLTHEGYVVPPKHHAPLTIFLCDERGKVKMELNTLTLSEFPPTYEYAGVRYSRHHMNQKSAEYRPEKKS